jgi:hypothetical protein
MVGPDFFQNRSRGVNLVQDVFTVFPIKARRTNVDGMVERRKRCSMIRIHISCVKLLQIDR